jgi:cell division protein FtsW
VPRKRRRRKTKSSSERIKGKGDRALYIVIMGLILFGTLMVFSGSVPIAATQNFAPYHYFIRQLIFFFLGIIVFLITYNINYHHYKKIIIPALGFTLVLLILVLFTPQINNTNRWLDLGLITVQVSDIAKLTLTIYLASWLSKDFDYTRGKDPMREYIIYNLLPFLAILGFFSLLIIIQPDLSTTMLIGIIAITIYYLSGSDRLHTIGTFGIFLTMGLAGAIAGLIAPYRFDRLSTFSDFLLSGELNDPFGTDYQLRQILIAVGTGGIWGEGFAQSKQKFSYLTETAFSDTIFAIFAEELGFLGSIILIGIFVWIMLKGFKIALNAQDKFGALLAAGITVWISMQAFIHFAVNVGLMPLTGMPLPFVSYGGSSLIVSMCAVGILINISRYSKEYE